MDNDNSKEQYSLLGDYVKHYRNLNSITQSELALQSGVGLRFIRELESGKTTLRIDKINQVLSRFGSELRPVKIDDTL